MVRPPCFDSNGMKKGAWSKEEDDKLRAYILRYGHWNWRLLPKFAGLARCGKSCRLRWVNYLKPGLKRGNLTKSEQDLVIQLHAQLGNKWSAIAARLPGRTDNEIKNFWHTRVEKHHKRKSSPSSSTTTKVTGTDQDFIDDDNDDDGVFSFKQAQEVLITEASSSSSNNNYYKMKHDKLQESVAVEHERVITTADEVEMWPAPDIFLPTTTYDVDSFRPLVEYNCNDIINGFNAEFHCSELSISSDSTYLTALDHWSIGDHDQDQDHHTISYDLWAADSHFTSNSTEQAEGGFYDALLPPHFNHGFNY